MVCFWILSVGLYSSFWFGCRARHDIDQTRTIQGGSFSSMKWNNDASVKHKLPFFSDKFAYFFRMTKNIQKLVLISRIQDLNTCFCHPLDFLSFSSLLNPRTTSPHLIHKLFALGIITFEWHNLKEMGCLLFGPSEFFKALTIPKIRWPPSTKNWKIRQPSNTFDRTTMVFMRQKATRLMKKPSCSSELPPPEIRV